MWKKLPYAAASAPSFSHSSRDWKTFCTCQPCVADILNVILFYFVYFSSLPVTLFIHSFAHCPLVSYDSTCILLHCFYCTCYIFSVGLLFCTNSYYTITSVQFTDYTKDRHASLYPGIPVLNVATLPHDVFLWVEQWKKHVHVIAWGLRHSCCPGCSQSKECG